MTSRVSMVWRAAVLVAACGALRVAPRRTLRMALKTDLLVVGSGISGSSLAHHASKSADVLLVEKNAVVGGNVISRRNDAGFVWEEGPNSFQPNPACMQTAHELGIASELVYANPTLPPWVFWEGKLYALPKNLPGDLVNFNLLSWPGKIRAGLGAIGFPGVVKPAPADYEEDIEEFVTRHLGRETFERIIEPFVSGVYAGDPKKLAIGQALKKIFRLQSLSFNGALVPGAVVRFQEIADEKKNNPPKPEWPTYKAGELCSFRLGLQTLPKAVARSLGEEKIRTGWKLESLARQTTNGSWLATFRTAEGNVEEVEARTVVSTAPAHALKPIVEPLDSETAAALDAVYYPPVAAVTVAYPKTAFKESCKELRGFGNLNPRSQRVRTLGTIWSSSLFEGRAPETHHLLLNYIGGSKDVGIADLSEEDLVAEVDAGCRAVLLKPDAPPPTVLGVKVWPTAIPQYERGHGKIIANLDAFEANHPGLYLGGNYRTGVAFGDCVNFGIDQAAKVLAYLDSTGAAQVDETEDLVLAGAPV